MLAAGFFLWSAGSGSDIAGPTAAVSTPIPSEPTAVPTPVEFAGWRGEYFSNPELQGEPVLIRDDQDINFQWGTNPPAPGMPVENYSVRWTISREVPAGIYRFTGTFDNGVRLWIDDNLIVDKWVTAPVGTESIDVNLAAGSHTVRLEYFHSTGPAVAQLRVDFLENFPDWKAEYFAQPDFNSPPVVVRNEQEINHNWGSSSPIPGSVPDNNYAVRWTRGADFVDGNYIFRAEVEGGVRVYLNNQIIIDSWGESALRQVDGVATLGRGKHGLNVILIVTDDQGLEGTVNQLIQVVEAGVPPEPTAPVVPTPELPEAEQLPEPLPEPTQEPQTEQPVEPAPEATEEPQQEQQEGTTEGDGN